MGRKPKEIEEGEVVAITAVASVRLQQKQQRMTMIFILIQNTTMMATTYSSILRPQMHSIIVQLFVNIFIITVLELSLTTKACGHCVTKHTKSMAYNDNEEVE
jgi:hypothetical protein